MTTDDRPGRSAARPPLRAPFRFLAAALLASLATPALADVAPRVTAEEAAVLAAIAPPQSVDTPALPERGALLAGDINRLLPAQAKAASTVSGEENGRVQGLLQRALALLGTPYRWGGTSPDGGFDCSGLVGYVFRTALGIDLPRVSREQARTGELVADRAALAAGDLVFFGRKGRVDHVGIYVGEGKFVHAPSRGKDVTVSSLDTGYWSGKFMSARRIPM
ncbi:MAG: C40 family peptidase [Gammaproteobacteria bacterium]